MPYSHAGKFVLAISTRALFDLETEHEVFLRQGERAYQALHERLRQANEPLRPGPAMGLVRALCSLNPPEGEPLVEVVLLSRCDGVPSLRMLNAAAEAGLPIVRGIFTRGRSPVAYLEPLKADLFLTASEEDAKAALAAGVPAAVVVRPKDGTAAPAGCQPHEGVHVALDGDCAVFGPEAEIWFRKHGCDVEAFNAEEQAQAETPLSPGPAWPLLKSLSWLRERTRAEDGSSLVRIGLFTTRSAPAHARAQLTLQSWGLEFDEVAYLGGLPKADHLRAFGADLFLDDQQVHCELAAEFLLSGRIPIEVAS